MNIFVILRGLIDDAESSISITSTFLSIFLTNPLNTSKGALLSCCMNTMLNLLRLQATLILALLGLLIILITLFFIWQSIASFLISLVWPVRTTQFHFLHTVNDTDMEILIVII